ncbi:MAG: VCBS repeat-containing protein [Bryobacterales bacterium]|nr:VCBS repeat-containing protein [Bryobacterales bacterium]
MRRTLLLLSLFSVALFSQNAWQRFSSKFGDLPVPFPGTQQTASLIADLDNDGLNDFVITDRSDSPSMVWYRRSPAGWSRYVLENVRLSIEAGGAAWDIDADGDLDLVFGGDGGNNEIWWWENPAPAFDSNVPWTRRNIKKGDGNKHHDQLAADFDGDGKIELISWNQGSRKLLFYRAPADPKSSGPWTAATIFTWPEGEMEGLAICDVNGDGKTDLVGGGRWFEHTSGDTFRDRVIDASVPFSRAACGQLKKGGWAEVVFVVGDGVGRLRWYEHVNGQWLPKDLLGHDVVHGHSLDLGDVDGDGNLDVYCAEMGQWIHPPPYATHPNSRTWIFYGNGQGGFEKSVVSIGYGTHEGRLADLDGDGRVDILAKPYHWDAPRVDVLLNRGNVRNAATALPLDRWRRQVIDSEKPWRAVFIDAADLDGDGLRDIVAGGWWYRNPGRADLPWTRTLFGSPFHNFAALIDANGDGLLDVIGTQGKGSEANAKLLWAQNRGGGRFTIHHNIPEAKGDFLQGALAYPLAGGSPQVALSWHKAGAGLQLIAPPGGNTRPDRAPWNFEVLSTESQDEQLSAADIDRDGRVDLLTGTWWFRNEGNGRLTRHILNPTAGDPDRNRLGDLNGDGRVDAIVGFEAVNVPGKLTWYEQPQDPTGTWTEHLIENVVGPMSLDVADMDGDGDLDVVVGEHNYKNPETATLWIFENANGQGTSWKRHAVYKGDEHHDGARVVDIDDDGDLDIISLGWSHGRVMVYENLAVQRPR